MNQIVASIEQEHSVVVNDGSGVLIQSMSKDYAYILTAKHCLQTDKDDPNSPLLNEHKVVSSDSETIEVLDIVLHETKDIAILIVPPIDSIELILSDVALTNNDKVRLCGYPADRRQEKFGYVSHIFNYSDTVNGEIILSPNGALAFDNIVGFSGGGLFSLSKPIGLCAIETKMNGNTEREFHGNISAISVKEFINLINESNQKYKNLPLAKILPLHLSSFEHLIDFSFNIIKSWENDKKLLYLISILKKIAKDKIKVNLYPHEILKDFEQYIRVHSRPNQEVHDRELWISLLEVITLSLLIDQPTIINKSFLETIFKSRRLVFIGVNETWQQHISDIFEAELKDLNNGGIIVAKTLISQRQVQFENDRLNRLINNRHNSRTPSNPDNIVNVRSNIEKISSIVDLTALHAECIENKENIFESLTDAKDHPHKLDELKRALAKEYGAYLTVVEAGDDK
ncbi:MULTISPECIES: ABC-three component system protein [unclassified Pseudoalteromonas]|uniref:ABC-three component system protein n=1 Tax=unclassified Pseudoalteromonas TaxID=194690 RepID=UPI000C08548A|nr:MULTISPECIES: ABC-three component system protein [unclassified Pseudoalteromonas]MDP2636564.1 serine protease [Pseudoalteromonas sp. 1_MG-2023]PHN89722.1 serine protease [Pseudoalteromonas sp. 3D05]